MKLDCIEISGITTVVFYRANKFTRQLSDSGVNYWYDKHRGKFLSSKNMKEIIHRCMHNPKKRVWVHGESINIVRKDRGNKQPHHPMLAERPTTKYYTLSEARRLLDVALDL